MNRIIRNTLIIAAPFLFMIIVNEIYRPFIKENPSTNSGTPTMNPSKANPNKCSWQCHNNATYCLEHHVKSPQSVTSIINPFYNGIIFALKSTGNYRVANIIFLVILWPFIKGN